MALNLKEQVKNLIERSNFVLIPLPKDPGADAIASAWVLNKYLKKLQKNVDICGKLEDKRYDFLIKEFQIKDSIELIAPFVISVNLKNTKLKEFKYDIEDSILKIYLYSENKEFKKEDVSLKEGDPEYDLVITLDTPELESLGDLYYKYPTFFLSTPIINIDNSPANENYGTVNFIDTKSSSITEILYNFLKSENFDINQEISTALLSGIIEKTNCFRKSNLSPLTFNTIGELVDKGADREYLIKELYQNKPLSAVKLWGRALSKLKTLTERAEIVWTILPNEDFKRSKAGGLDLKLIFSDFASYIPSTKIAFIIAEYEPKKIRVLISNNDFKIDLYKIFNIYSIKKARDFYYFEVIGQDILDVEREVVDLIKNNI